MDAKFSGFIGGCRDHSPGARVADDKRLPLEGRIVESFHSGKKGVHVGMDDFPAGVQWVDCQSQLPSCRIVPDSL